MDDRAAIDVVTPSDLGTVVQVIAGCQQYADVPEAIPPRPISDKVRQSVRRLVGSAVALESA